MLIHNAQELESYSRSEEDRLEAIIKGIADAGARIVAAGSAFGEMALHFVEKYGMMAVRIPSKFDLRRFCRWGWACRRCTCMLACHVNAAAWQCKTDGCMDVQQAAWSGCTALHLGWPCRHSD